jgi:hypothetical protein
MDPKPNLCYKVKVLPEFPESFQGALGARGLIPFLKVVTEFMTLKYKFFFCIFINI